MMKRHEHLTAILIAAILAGALLSCGDDSAQTDSTTENTESASADSTIAEEKPNIPDSLDFGGEEFHVLTGTFVQYCDLTRDESDGEVLNDAIYNMEINTENRLNVDIIEERESFITTMDHISRLVQAGDDTYDVVHQLARLNIVNLIGGALRPLTDASYLDLTAPWWNPQITDQLMVSGEYWLGSSASNVNLWTNTSCIAINTKMAGQFDIDMEEIYDAVRDGTWTYDMMTSYASRVTGDTDGDGQMTENDRWGLLARDDNIFPLGMIVAGGEQALIRDENGNFKANWGTERFYDLAENAYRIFHSPDYSRLNDRYVTSDFVNGNALFMQTIFSGIDDLADMQDDYTLVPMPKYEASQVSYYCCSFDGLMTFALPKSVSDLEMTGAVLEWISYEGKQNVEDAYIESTMKYKRSRDETMIEMVGLCLDSAVIDLGCIFAAKQCSYDAMDAMMRAETFNLASYIEQTEKALTANLEALQEAVEQSMES